MLVRSLGKHSPKNPRREPSEQSAASSGPTRGGSPWGTALSGSRAAPRAEGRQQAPGTATPLSEADHEESTQ